MKTDTREKIVTFIKQHGKARVHDLVNFLGMSHVAVHKQLVQLVQSGLLKKIGKTPLVYYQPSGRQTPETQEEVSGLARSIIEKEYLYITPTGEIVSGLDGFARWNKEHPQTQGFRSLAEEYAKIRSQANLVASKEGWIDATKKFETTFSDLAIDRVLYQDFYSLPKFGKTKLGQLVFHAKQSQNRPLVVEVVRETKPILNRIKRIFRSTARFL